MMRRRRGRGRRSSWNWAYSGTLILVDTSASVAEQIVSPNLFPAARTDWFLENGRGRDHMTVTGILMWLQLSIGNQSTTTAYGLASELNFWVQKYKADNVAGQSPAAATPYGQPSTPASVTSWTTFTAADEQDGLDPFLWTHYLNPGCVMAASSQAVATGDSIGYGSNQMYELGAAVAPNIPQVCYPPTVRAAWQPDVVIKSKRRLMKGEGLQLGMSIPAGNGTGNGVISYSLTYRVRVLTS